jgi:hypothetical protein
MKSTRVSLVFALLLMLLGLAPVASAAVVENLYQSRVLVDDRSEALRDQAFAEALVKVVRKVTGETSPMSNAVIRNAARRSKNYLQQYGYSVETNSVVNEDGLPVELEQTWLEVGFSQQGIGDLVRQAGLPLWSSNRPDIVLWAVVDERGKRNYLSVASDNEHRQLVMEMQEWGLPVVEPLLDLEDQIAASVNTLWSLDEEKITTASARYNPGATLVGKIARTSDGNLRGSWLFLFQDEQVRLDVQTDSMEEFVRRGVTQVVQQIARRYAIDPMENSGAIFLTVSGVEQFASFDKVNRYLDSLESVQRLELKRIVEDRVEFLLSLEGRLELLQEIISLGGVLEQTEPPVSDKPVPDQSVPESVAGENGEQPGEPAPESLGGVHLYYRLLTP